MEKDTPKRVRRINPFTDTGFKVLFGKENQSEEILCFFLNALFEEEEDFSKIVSVKYINNERVRDNVESKTLIHDVMCTTDDGRRFIVEMQNVPQPFFMARAYYYACRGIADQGKMHDEEGKLWSFDYEPVYGVFMCNFNIDAKDPSVTIKGRMLNVKTHHPLRNFLRMTFLQLPKFNKSREECKTFLDKFIYILVNMETLNGNPFAAEMEKVYARIEKISRYTALSREEKAQYDADVKWYLDTNAILNSRFNEGKAEGVEIGKAEGREMGRVEVIKGMIEAGCTNELIEKVTNLSLSDIEALRNSLKAGSN